MSIVTDWHDLIQEVARKFPETDTATMATQEGDVCALMRHVADCHDLTLAEAAEVVTFRVPQYLEAPALTA